MDALPEQMDGVASQTEQAAFRADRLTHNLR
jgi:hypothetical protein